MLFRHSCLLAGVAGVAAFREPGPGLVFLVAILLLDPAKTARTGALLLILSFLLGTGYAKLREPVPPPEPVWLAAALSDEEADPYGRIRPSPLLLRGSVGKVTPQSGGGVRFFLHDARPAEHFPPLPVRTLEGPVRDEPYSGKILVTLRNAGVMPLEGQMFDGALRLSRIRTLKNPGVWNAEEYWQDRGTWIRGWTSKTIATPKTSDEEKPETMTRAAGTNVTGAGGFFSRLHATLKQRFLHSVFLARGFSDGITDISGTSYAMLPALIFGDRSFLSSEQTDAIARSSLAHSLALSGLHLGYAVAIGAALAWFAGRVHPGIYTRIPRPRLAVLAALPLAAMYVWLGGAPVSLLRAACMFVFWALLLFWNKPKVMLDGLILAVSLLVLVDPSSPFATSLQLSALSVAVIALSLPMVRHTVGILLSGPEHPGGGIGREAHGQSMGFRGAALEILFLSLLIQLVTGPLVLKSFGTAALWFPLNLVWLPILGVVVMPLAFTALLLSSLNLSLPSALCLYLANIPCEGLMRLLDVMDGSGILAAPALMRPHWISIAGWWLICLALLLLFRTTLPGRSPHGKRSTAKGKALPALELPSGGSGTAPSPCNDGGRARAMLLAGVVMFLLPLGVGWLGYLTQPVGIRLLDVGQGQAVLVEWPGGRVMIDGGGMGGGAYDVGKSVVAQALTDNRPARVDMLIHTHPDSDHMSGLMYLLESFAVKTYAGNGDVPSGPLMERWQNALTQKSVQPVVWKAGDIIPLSGSLRLEVLWPRRDDTPGTVSKRGEETNNASLVIRLVWGEKPLALLCGDAGPPVLRQLARTDPDALRAEVLVLPHHGSASGLSPEFYNAVQPKTALVSCGWQNRWGFPARAVTDWFGAAGIPVHSTSVNGQIGVHWKAPEQTGRLRMERTLSR